MYSDGVIGYDYVAIYKGKCPGKDAVDGKGECNG